MKHNSPTRKKVLLAVAFVGSMLNAQLPSQSQSATESAKSLSQPQATNLTALHHLISDNEGTPEIRAYCLLRLAEGYLAGRNKKELEGEFTTVVLAHNNSQYFDYRGRANRLVQWSERISSEESGTADWLSGKATPEEATLAKPAIDAALTLVSQSSEQLEQLNLLFIASKLYARSGDREGMEKCNTIVEQAIRSTEESNFETKKGSLTNIQDAKLTERTILAASSILKSMAYGIIPIRVLDREPNKFSTPPKALTHEPTEKEFEECERLELRALALMDRLAATNHERRKAHRDLALWYTQVGKPSLAEKQKQILFELIGSKDDRFLYPRSIGCGNLLWWDYRIIPLGMFCGMG